MSFFTTKRPADLRSAVLSEGERPRAKPRLSSQPLQFEGANSLAGRRWYAGEGRLHDVRRLRSLGTLFCNRTEPRDKWATSSLRVVTR